MSAPGIADAPTVVQTDSTLASSPSSMASIVPMLALSGLDGPRYVVVEPIGHGGMGMVWRAYDARLHREVALKRLRTDVFDDAAEGRLVREAQAMARLSHPNVVAVYDVQRSAEGVELAMELVGGVTLQEWLQAQRRPQAEVLAAFRQAGEGLAAAHRAGLIHRDFKPSNVLIGADGRVKVTDFGLAKAASETPSVDGCIPADTPDSSSSYEAFDPLGSPLTRAGTIVGTLRYMAPEQLVNGPVDARSDQYAFCVALWYALVGRPPFPDRLEPMEAAKREGPPPWPTSIALPRRWVDAIRRGLAADPMERWPSMDALLAAMSTTTSRRVRRLGSLVAVSALAGVAVWGATRSEAPDERCRGAAEQLRGIWDDERRGVVAEALSIGGAEASASVVQALDGYAAKWVIQHEDACAATTLRGEQSASVMDLRMRCLARARTQLRASTELLSTADDEVAHEALAVVEGLPGLARCEDLERLAAQRPEPDDPNVAAQVEATREQLARVAALELAGKWDEGLALARAQVEAAEATGFAPLVAEAGHHEGALLQQVGRYREAVPRLRQVVQAAVAQGDDELAVRSGNVLTNLLADSLGRPDEAQWLALVVLGITERNPSDLRGRGAALANYATILCLQDLLLECEAQRRLALGVFEQVGLPRQLAIAHGNLASVLVDRGQLEEGQVETERSLELYASALGLDHPDVAHAYVKLGVLRFHQQRYDDATAALRRAIELFDAGQGPRGPWALAARGNLGTVLAMQGKLDEAEQLIRGALAGHGDEAPDHRIAELHQQLGAVLADQGRYDEAIVELERSLAMLEALGGPDQSITAELRFNLGATASFQGRHELALEHYERAWVIAQRVQLADATRALMAASLAEALGQAGIDRPRARGLAEQARALLGEPPSDARLREEIDAWIAAQDARPPEDRRERDAAGSRSGRAPIEP